MYRPNHPGGFNPAQIQARMNQHQHPQAAPNVIIVPAPLPPVQNSVSSFMRDRQHYSAIANRGNHGFHSSSSTVTVVPTQPVQPVIIMGQVPSVNSNSSSSSSFSPGPR